MGDKEAICQFCLQLFTENTPCPFNDEVSNASKTFFARKNVQVIANAIICQVCLKNLESAYNFTLTANDNNLKMLDATIEYDDEVCQTCLSPVQNPHIYLYDHSENIAPFTAIQKMLKYCLINLDLAYRQHPIMCDICWEVLKTSYRFLIKCEHNQGKILQFCEEQNITIIGTKDLKKFGKTNTTSLAYSQSAVHKNVTSTQCTRSDMNTACSSASPDDIFSEIKIELEENTIRREIKREDVDINTDGIYDIPTPYENSDTLFSNILNIKTEDANKSIPASGISDVSQRISEDSGINVSPTHDNRAVSSATSSENDIKKKLYIEMKRLELKQISKKRKCRIAGEQKTEAMYKCNVCSYSFKKRYAYNRHVATHMTLEECAKYNMLFRCDSCSYKSKHKYSLLMHMRRIHNLSLIAKYNDTSSTEKVSPTIITKSDKFVLKCSNCDFESKTYTSMEKHAMAHKNTRTKKLYKCEVCSYQAKKKSSISRHVVTHSTLKELSAHNKLYKCDYCNYKTKRRDSLVPHVRKKHGDVKQKALKTEASSSVNSKKGK